MPKITSYAVEPYTGVCQKDLDVFIETISSLQRSLNDSNTYVGYLQERVRSQNTVVYALMTQQDARINIKLAMASKDLAESAKVDSASMKTIAILTMLFLPGTFFSALWAVPSLRWEPIQNEFWWYWAFTGPSTILVFAIWFGLHKWAFYRASRLKKGRRVDHGAGGGYEKLDEGTPPPPPLAPPLPPAAAPLHYGSHNPTWWLPQPGPASGPPAFVNEDHPVGSAMLMYADDNAYWAPTPLPSTNTEMRGFATDRHHPQTSVPAGYFH